MDKRQDIIKKLSRFKKELNKRVRIDSMIFFGSTAKGRAKKWSDIDLLIVSKNFKNVKTYKRAKGFRDYWNLNYPVDFLCYTPAEFRRLSKRVTIVREAVKEGIEI